VLKLLTTCEEVERWDACVDCQSESQMNYELLDAYRVVAAKAMVTEIDTSCQLRWRLFLTGMDYPFE
jgi:thymidine kinase